MPVFAGNQQVDSDQFHPKFGASVANDNAHKFVLL
jgi:hypothetical protein